MLELDQPLAPPAELGPPLIDEQLAGQSRQALEQLQTVAATIPAPPQTNPLEDMVREMLRPILKQWLDEHLPQMVDEHVKREISRITGRPFVTSPPRAVGGGTIAECLEGPPLRQPRRR